MPRVAVVTGSNKGIGFAIVRALCKRLDKTDVVYLTSRKEALGLEAVKTLQAEGLSPQYHQLDIADQDSSKKLRDHLQKSHGGFDILVNNAGILLRDSDLILKEKVERTLKTNYFDTMKTYYILMPILRPHGRVVFVSSGLGPAGYRQISDNLKKCFRDAKTEDDVNKLMQRYQSDVKAGVHAEAGWPAADCGYNISKLGICVATKVLAESLKDDSREGILINSFCPGWVSTDMTSHMGSRTIDQGAETAIDLSLLPIGTADPQGRYVNAQKKVKNFLDR